MFHVNEFVVIGIACTSKELAKALNKEAEVSEYLCDESNRACTCFIGIVINNSDISKDYIPDLSLDYYLSLYIDTVKSTWDSKTLINTIILSTPTLDVTMKQYEKKYSPKCENIKGINAIYSSTLESNLDYFYYCIFNQKNESFMSDYQYKNNDDNWIKLHYTNIAIDDETIRKLKYRYGQTTSSIMPSKNENITQNNTSKDNDSDNDSNPEVRVAKEFSNNNNASKSPSSQKKTFQISPGMWFSILLVVMVIFFLLKCS